MTRRPLLHDAAYANLLATPSWFAKPLAKAETLAEARTLAAFPLARRGGKLASLSGDGDRSFGGSKAIDNPHSMRSAINDRTTILLLGRIRVGRPR